MAAEPFTTTRRTLLGAAAALPIAALPVPERGLSPTPDPARTLWTRRLAVYRRCHARWKEAAETGFFRAANEEYNRVYSDLIARHGSWQKARRWRRDGPQCAAAFARISAAEETFYHRCTAPMQRAAGRLALTPPPNLEALLAKIRAMHEHELGELGCMTRPVLQVLAEDVERLIDA
jgi:hypothetical protein